MGEMKKGGAIKAGGNLVIGQEQDTVGGKFDATQAFVGKLYNINVWDYALNSTQVAFLYETGLCGYGTTEVEPFITYLDIINQQKAGDLTVQDGNCPDLQDASDGKILRFPPQSKASTANYLQFSPDFGADTLGAFSICTWFFKTYGDQGRYFLSYAVTGLDNSIILGEQATLGFWVSNERMVTDILLDEQTWYHLCFTWASDSGAAIYIDGAKVKEGALASGKAVKKGGMLNIGQEQDSVGGRFDKDQAFAGSLYNLNMFNLKLSDEEVAKLYGDVTFDSGESAWRHGGMHCAGGDLDEDAHKPDCWKVEEKIKYKDSGSLGYIIGDVDAAKAACYAYEKCKTLTCGVTKAGETKCEMKETFEKAKKDKKKTSYTYRC